MITFPIALILAKGLQSAVGMRALFAALLVSLLVYALDWASSQEAWNGDVAVRRFVYVIANTAILTLVLAGVVTLEALGLG